MGKHNKHNKHLNRRQKRLFKFQNFDAETQDNILQLAMFTEWLKNVKNINHDDYQNYDEQDTSKLLQEYIQNLSSEFRQYNFAGKQSTKALHKLDTLPDDYETISAVKQRIIEGGRGDPLILRPDINTNINNNFDNDKDYDPYDKDEEDKDYDEKYLDEDDVKEPQYESVSVMDTNIIMPIQRGFMDLAGQQILDRIKWGAETSFSLTDKAQRLLGLDKLGKYTGIPLTLSQIADKLKSDLASNQQIHGNFSAKFECECDETFDTRKEAYKHQIFYQLQRIHGHDYLSSPNYPSIMGAPEEKTELIKTGDGDDYVLWECECGDTFDTKHKAYVHQDIKKLNKEPGHSYLIPSRSYQVQINSGVIECQICKKHLKDSNNKLNRIVHPFGCGHEFHFECLRKYIIKKGKIRNCPLCIRSVKYKNQEEEIDEEDLVKAVRQLLLEKNLPIIQQDEEDEKDEKDEDDEESFPLAKALGLFVLMQSGAITSNIIQNLTEQYDEKAVKQGAQCSKKSQLEYGKETSIHAKHQERQYNQKQHELRQAEKQGALCRGDQNFFEHPQSFSVIGQQGLRNEYEARNTSPVNNFPRSHKSSSQSSRPLAIWAENDLPNDSGTSPTNNFTSHHKSSSESSRPTLDIWAENDLSKFDSGTPVNNFTSHHKSSSQSSKPTLTDRWAKNKNDGKLSDLLGSGGQVRDDAVAVKEVREEAGIKIAQKEHDERIHALKVAAVGASIIIGGSVLMTATSIPTSVPVYTIAKEAARQRTHHVAEMLMSASSYLGVDGLGLSTISRMIPGAPLEHFRF